MSKLKSFRTNSQCDKILRHLQSGESLTVLQAQGLGFGANCRSRISDIKSAGHNVISKNILFNGGFIAKYSMIKASHEANN